MSMVFKNKSSQNKVLLNFFHPTRYLAPVYVIDCNCIGFHNVVLYSWDFLKAGIGSMSFISRLASNFYLTGNGIDYAVDTC